ncbi:hypothetical protein [Marixanthomonas spongiae]|uniref:Uncharacterized protein n=1 Tax=Marixanthomonas spongiae TaxID=2174845 RepID=A0A2U0HXE9_9FLAO|nr:hypothetical protein [Marixanthomonas spongiae]PVW13535.1 hypothetical protein DDV96_12825 [Marixanthomonas spongiae]
MKYDASRREFFQKIMLASAGVYLLPMFQACDSGETITIPEGTGMQPFKTWEEMRYALSHSSDNFLAKRDRLVQQKDPKAMFDFVREELLLLPSDNQYLRRIGYGTMYGIEQGLRCGMATPREKAEILKNMLIDAGFEARTVREHIALDKEKAKEILFRKNEPTFSIPVSSNQYRKWQKALGADENQGNFKPMPDVVAEAKALANNLLDTTEPQHRKEDRESKFYFSNRNVPGVAFKQKEQEVYLHLFDPSVEYGMLHPANEAQKAYDLKEFKEDDFDVSLSIKTTNSFDMREETEILSATYKASELVGNQLKLQFLNNLTFEEQATQSINSINTFTPSIALQDLDKDVEYLQERSFVGDPITLGGENIFKEAVLFSEETAQGKPAGNPDQVRSLTVKARPKVFPNVELELLPKDADGNIVEGLAAGNFKIQDNETGVRGMLRKNVIAPKILLVYDTSMSMPSEYRGKGIQKFLNQMQGKIRELYPNVLIELMKTGSNVYTTHLKVAQTSNDLVLYATDGHNNDTYQPEYKDVYEAGPPIIYLNVYDDTFFYDKIRENIAITEISASDQEAVIAEVSTILGEMELAPYVFSYNTFEKEGEHQVHVSLFETSITATDSYSFPKGVEQAVGKRIVGLYLDIKVGRQGVKRRILAGYNKTLQYSEPPTKQMANEVHEMLLGNLSIAFEKAGATTSVRFSEYLKALLSTRNWMEPYLKGETQTAAENFEKGGFDYPSVLLSMMQPIQESVNEETATYVNGMRVGILKFKPALFTETSHVSFDYLRTSQYRTLTRSGKGWIRANAQKTAQLALLEGRYFPVSTYSQLKGEPLQFSENLPDTDQYTSKSLGEDYTYFREYLFRGGKLNFFDASTKKKAFWSIDHKYGELYGILPNMTGGGGENIKEQLEGLQTVIDDYQRVISGINLGIMAAGGGLALGVVAAYSVTLVKLYALASQAIIIMDTAGMDDEIAKAMQALACNIYKEILYMGLGPVGEGMAGVENLIGMMGGNYSFVSC